MKVGYEVPLGALVRQGQPAPCNDAATASVRECMAAAAIGSRCQFAQARCPAPLVLPGKTQ